MQSLQLASSLSTPNELVLVTLQPLIASLKSAGIGGLRIDSIIVVTAE